MLTLKIKNKYSPSTLGSTEMTFVSSSSEKNETMASIVIPCNKHEDEKKLINNALHLTIVQKPIA